MPDEPPMVIMDWPTIEGMMRSLIKDYAYVRVC